MLKRYSQKQLKAMVAEGLAIDLTNSNSQKDIPERYEQVGYASGCYGCIGKLFKGESGQYYAIIGRVKALYLF